MTTIKDSLAVCTWSLQPTDPTQLIQQLQTLGISRAQCALDPLREQPEVWGGYADLCRQRSITNVSGMFGCVGEDYSTMDSIRRTGGLVPDSTWDENWANIRANADIAGQMGLKLVTFHAGFLPHEETDPEFEKLLHRIRLVADVFAAKGIDLAFETGQETADSLENFLEKLGRANVGVNFDPANMILYDKGNPIEALRTLGAWLKQCHIKDAKRSPQLGQYGEEVVVGTGEVNWKEFFRTLDEFDFRGWLCIEREADNQRLKDIQAARELVESLA